LGGVAFEKRNNLFQWGGLLKWVLAIKRNKTSATKHVKDSLMKKNKIIKNQNN